MKTPIFKVHEDGSNTFIEGVTLNNEAANWFLTEIPDRCFLSLKDAKEKAISLLEAELEKINLNIIKIKSINL